MTTSKLAPGAAPSAFVRDHRGMLCGAKRHVLQVICLLVFLMPMAAQTQPIELAFPQKVNQLPSYGRTVQGLSDLTGDGIGELAVATSETIPGVGETGSVYILSGKDFSVVHRLVPPKAVPGPGFGHDLAEVSDLNGDKVPEIIVAWPFADTVFIFSGASGEVLQTLASLENPLFGFAWAVAGLGTTRPNSAPTVAVSAPVCCFPYPANKGKGARIYIFNAITGELQFTIETPVDKRWFGETLANIGDIDGDGRDDLAVGAGAPDAPLGRGAAFIVSGETGEVLHELTIPLPANIDYRWDVAAVPDVNGDGKNDVLVGIGGGARSGARPQSGHAYLFSGEDGKLLRSLVSPSPKVNGGFGWSVAGVPDVTGDGAGGLLIGAATDASVGLFGTFGERKMYLINGATGQTIQSFASPYVGEGFGLNIGVLRGKEGMLRNLIAGVPREKSNAGRVFAFPLRFLSATRSIDGIHVSLTATDDTSHDLQASPDLKTWTTLTTLKAAAQPVTFVDNAASRTGHRFYRAQRATP